MNKKYNAVVEKNKVGDGLNFSVTHDGRNWTSIRIENPLTEIPHMILALQNYVIGYGVGILSAVKEKYLDSSK